MKSTIYTSKILFLFPVSFTIEYKVGIAEFYVYMGFGAGVRSVAQAACTPPVPAPAWHGARGRRMH